MIKIGDFSWICRVSVKTLRHYDRLDLLKPIRIDPQNSYRYYSIDQLPQLNRILALKDVGLSLAQISQLLDSDLPPQEFGDMLRRKRIDIEAQLEELQLQLTRVKSLEHQLASAAQQPHYEVAIKTVEAQPVAFIRDMIPPYDHSSAALNRLFTELEDYVSAHNICPVGPKIALWCDDEDKTTDVDIEVAIPINRSLGATQRIKTRTLPKGQMACMVHRGRLETIHQAYMAGFDWIESSGYCFTSSIREVYLQQGCHACEDVVELQFPVGKI